MRNLQLEIEEDLDGCGLDAYLLRLILACCSKADVAKEEGHDSEADIWTKASDDLAKCGPYGR